MTRPTHSLEGERRPEPRAVSEAPRVRALLEQDRCWSIYAIGDLDPRRAEHCRWFTTERSVALLYQEFDTPVLFAAGEPDVLDAVPPLAACYLQVPQSFMPAVERRFTLEWRRPMHRMWLDRSAMPAASPRASVEPLDERHEDEIRALYDDGREAQEEPDFFFRSQLQDGTFFGARVDGRLAAAGGTHLYSSQESVGAIGNVYTHRACRGRGFGTAITAAVAARLVERGTRTIALNVKHDNRTAIRLYERLGFRFYCRYWEARGRTR